LLTGHLFFFFAIMPNSRQDDSDHTAPRYFAVIIKPNTQLLPTSLLTNLLTYLLTPWRRVLLEKLTGIQPVKKYRAFYGTRNFIRLYG